MKTPNEMTIPYNFTNEEFDKLVDVILEAEKDIFPNMKYVDSIVFNKKHTKYRQFYVTSFINQNIPHYTITEESYNVASSQPKYRDDRKANIIEYFNNLMFEEWENRKLTMDAIIKDKRLVIYYLNDIKRVYIDILNFINTGNIVTSYDIKGYINKEHKIYDSFSLSSTLCMCQLYASNAQYNSPVVKPFHLIAELITGHTTFVYFFTHNYAHKEFYELRINFINHAINIIKLLK